MTSFSCLLATDCLEMLAILKEIVEKQSVLSFSISMDYSNFHSTLAMQHSDETIVFTMVQPAEDNSKTRK